MKKSWIVVITAVLLASLVGMLYIGRSFILKKSQKNGSGNIQPVEHSSKDETDNDITYGEYKYNLPSGDTVNCKYMKTGDTIKIFSLYPVDSNLKYDISPSGNAAVFQGKDSQIWMLSNNGTFQKVTPDKYNSIDKTEEQKTNTGYIWAEKPEFTYDGYIRFVSDLPDTGSTPQKSIWQIKPDGTDMKKVYTPLNADYRIMGNRDDGRLLILDGDIIAAVDASNSDLKTIDVKDKYILSLSTDGTRIIYTKKDGSSKTGFSGLYIIDSTGNFICRLPDIVGYVPDENGCWNSDGTRYAFIAKSVSGGKSLLAVVDFGENTNTINTYDINSSSDIPAKTNLTWADDSSVSIDTGNDMVNIDVK